MASSSQMDDARNLVKKLAQEIEELARSSVEPPTFFKEFLKRLVMALQAKGGAVWLVDPNGQLQLVADINLQEIGFYEDPSSLQKNHQLLVHTLSTGEAAILRPGASEQPLPTNHLLVLSSLQKGGECVGVVEIFQRPDASVESHAGMMQYVEHLAGLASWYLSKSEQEGSATVGAVQEDYDQFLNDLHRSLDLKQVTATAANDSRRLFGCDRVTICVQQGRKVAVEAISGQDKVNHRANLVRSLRKLAEAVMETREPFAFYGKADDLPPQLEKLLTDYLQESESRMLLLLPLLKPVKLVRDEDEIAGKVKKKDQLQPLLGCLIIEQINESEPRPGVKEYSELLEDHIAVAINNALDHKRIFLLPVWNFFGGIQVWFKGRRLAKTLAIAAAIFVIGLLLTFLPWDYRVEGNGRLMPTERQAIFSSANATVHKVLVNGGELVQKGDVLVVLRDDDLSLGVVNLRTEISEQMKHDQALETQVATLQAMRVTGEELRQVGNQIIEKIGERNSLKQEIQGKREQLKIMKQQLDRLTVRSPMTGTVATFQVEQLLRNRPVNRGESLMEVMNEKGPWRLELEVEEDRYGHIVQAQQKVNKKELPVEFILATASENTYAGELESIATRANTSAETGNILRVHVDFDRAQLPNMRIGSEVRAKINCGQKSLGYVLFGDVIEFIRKYLWL